MKNKKLIENTETLPKKEGSIDNLNLNSGVRKIILDQLKAVNIFHSNIDHIANIIEKIFKHVKNKNWKIFYAGAGTSARIGVQDGSELFPTFGWPKSKIKYLIAGGKKAIFSSIENAEDNIDEARRQVIGSKVSSNDIVIGLSASGSTPFTNEILKASSKIGALTIGITNNKNTLLEKNCKLSLILDTGGEVIGGSTRLKAGTSQKIALNLISTLLFSKLGYVKDGLMINVKPTNKKLVKRKKIINEILIRSNKI